MQSDLVVEVDGQFYFFLPVTEIVPNALAELFDRTEVSQKDLGIENKGSLPVTNKLLLN